MNTFRVKNFERFQHYKDRAPPWIKLYNELLDDYEFGALPDATKMHLIAIWLLASRSENKIPYDPTWVAKRINATEPVDLQLLIDRGFILSDQELQTKEQVASNVQAECLSREREEGETEERRAEQSARDETQKRVGDFRQAIVRAYAEANSPTLPETSRAELWITQGYQEDICLAVIAGIVRKRPNVAALSYFDGPIAEAHAKKAPPRKAINGHAPLDWDAIFTSYKKFGHWSRDAGNDPLSPNCRAPPDILRKYGFEPMGTA